MYTLSAVPYTVHVEQMPAALGDLEFLLFNISDHVLYSVRARACMLLGYLSIRNVVVFCFRLYCSMLSRCELLLDTSGICKCKNTSVHYTRSAVCLKG